MPEYLKGGASLIAAVALVVIASELYDDIVRPEQFEHFKFPKIVKMGLLSLTTFLIWEESAKARRAFTAPLQARAVEVRALRTVAA